MNLFIDSIPFIKWMIAAILFGVVEAVMFHQCRPGQLIPKRTFWEDEHVWLTIARFFVFLEIFSEYKNIYSLFIIFLPAMLVFPFLHDGFYYVMRNKLDRRVYPFKFTSQSNSTDATLSFDFYTRTIMFIVGIILFIRFVILAGSGYF